MLIVIDIGNTTIQAGAFKEGAQAEDEAPEHHWRLSTVRERTTDEYGITLLALLENAGISKSALSGAIMSCVVPGLGHTFHEAIEKYLGVTPIVVEPGIKTGMPILTDDPREVGADRIVNAVGAYALHKRELIVVDFGTAITFDYVTDKGEYAGGAIAPGIGISSEALVEKAARLPGVSISKPPSVIGRNTVDSIKSGLYYGFAGLVDGIVGRMKKQAVKTPLVIATGGYAHLVADDAVEIDRVDEFLVLKGLRKLYEVNAQ